MKETIAYIECPCVLEFLVLYIYELFSLPSNLVR